MPVEIYKGNEKSLIECLRIIDECLAMPKPCQMFRYSSVVETWFKLSGAPWHEMAGDTRDRRIVRWRDEFVGVMRAMTSLSFSEIAGVMGKRNHTTAHTCCHRWLQRPVHEREQILATMREILKQRRAA